ncbi:MAG: uncharacterized membrane protein (UPF0182 family) [Candidatus Azotimanducaceae bacterium]|jgi:uncharacterized membrane protein (UPF0182 family)
MGIVFDLLVGLGLFLFGMYQLETGIASVGRGTFNRWMAGLSDGENYGRLIAYNFPKDKRILGPQQVETKIDQNPFLSGQLTLWDQQGSEVIRGNVLAIPLDDILLYVEPIYLRAETAAYPELRLVVVMHGDNLSYAETFDEALKGLFSPADFSSRSNDLPL